MTIAADAEGCRRVSAISSINGPFVLADETQLRLGLGEGEIATDVSLTSRHIALRVPETVKVVKIEVSATKDPKTSWVVEVSGASARKFERLTLPEPGLYRVTFSAEHFRTEVRVVSVPASTDSGTPLRIDFIGVPELRGKIADLATLKPVERATITTAENEATMSDKDGAFRLEIMKKWPRSVRIDVPGYASTTIPVGPSGPETLPLILLSHGGILEAEIQHDDAVTIELERRSKDGNHLLAKQSKVLSREETHLSFRSLAPGRYRLHVSGHHPFEQLTTDIEIRDAQTTDRTIVLQPRTLRITVTRQNAPLGDVALRVSHVKGWEAKVVIPSTGVLEEPSWQTGDYVAMVVLPDGSTFRSAATLENEPLLWMIDVPARRLVVAPVDAESNLPVTKGTIILEEDLPAHVSTGRTVNDLGLAVFDGVATGHFKATAASPGYIQESVIFDVTDADTERQVPVPLHKSAQIQLQVTNSIGSPIERAGIITALDQYPTRTDVNGFGTIHLAQDKPGRVFIVPSDTSMAMVDVDANSAISPLPVVVPAGNCRITVTVKFEDGTAVPAIPLLWQFNGQPVPQQVTNLVIMQQRHRFEADRFGVFTLTGMPEGTYQFMAMGTSNIQSDGRRAASIPGALATVHAQAGIPNIAEITIPTAAPKASP
jgi:hypothetical protein